MFRGLWVTPPAPGLAQELGPKWASFFLVDGWVPQSGSSRGVRGTRYVSSWEHISFAGCGQVLGGALLLVVTCLLHHHPCPDLGQVGHCASMLASGQPAGSLQEMLLRG